MGYKEMMFIFRSMVLIATALLIAISLSLGAVAATTAHAPQPHYSSSDAPDHDNCDEAGDQDVSCQGCCHGISCASSGVLAQAAIALPFMLLISQPEPNATDHLFGRSIAPETGPPKLLA
ncbi:MAG: hypothetical protein ABL936_27045 [Aestuariivirga sp.]